MSAPSFYELRKTVRNKIEDLKDMQRDLERLEDDIEELEKQVERQAESITGDN